MNNEVTRREKVEAKLVKNTNKEMWSRVEINWVTQCRVPPKVKRPGLCRQEERVQCGLSK